MYNDRKTQQYDTALHRETDQDNTARLHILTVNTATNDEALSNWLLSVSTLGYGYKVLGQGQKWGGWPWRTALYMDAVRAIPSSNGISQNIVVLCDSGDLFFVLSPSELLKRFNTITLREKASVIMGGEPTCCTGDYSKSDMRKAAIERINEYATTKETTRWRYPNAGFIIGYRDRILEMLNDVKNSKDDQAGYLAKYLADRTYMYIDDKQEIVGNVNTYDDVHCLDCRIGYVPYYEETKRWESIVLSVREVATLSSAISSETDQNREQIYQRAYRNLLTGNVPAVLHFPGGNTPVYNVYGRYIYRNSFQEVAEKYSMSIPSITPASIIIPAIYSISKLFS